MQISEAKPQRDGKPKGAVKKRKFFYSPFCLKSGNARVCAACNYAYFEKFCGYVLHYSADCAKIKK